MPPKETPHKPVLGILGGLGPAASCYLYQMLTDHTPAARDQDHLDIVISSRASTPDRRSLRSNQSAAGRRSGPCRRGRCNGHVPGSLGRPRGRP